MPPTPPPLRPRHGVALGLAAASVVPAVVLGGAPAASAAAAVPVAVTADQQPTCGDPTAVDFPITTRIHGGPQTYGSGGGYGTWFLDLTNTTSKPCDSIHPVLVLTDEDRKLTSDQIQLEFSDPDRPDDLPHRVTWETTDRDEHIGVFGGDGADTFGGFTVPAGRTVTVLVRMAFTSDTDPNRITAKAAIVQRKQAAGDDGAKKTPAGDDGDWVGESDDYVFGVVEDEGDGGDTGGGDTGEEDTGGTGDVGGISRDGGVLSEPPLDSATPGTGEAGGVDGVGVVGGGGGVGGTRDAGGVDGGDGIGGTGDTPSLSASGEAPLTARDPQGPPELARTGAGAVIWTEGLAAGLCLAGGVAALRGTRRLRRTRR
ncbi:hypothetical protein [Streptomyces sp. NPDC048496]|uniref:hypothetical protein n=1 Tax=Streptomyces sp. NPDC048496 TaxID=3365558 RepID=UPI0037163B6F